MISGLLDPWEPLLMDLNIPESLQKLSERTRTTISMFRKLGFWKFENVGARWFDAGWESEC